MHVDHAVRLALLRPTTARWRLGLESKPALVHESSLAYAGCIAQP